jgi:hypothetical protein
MLRAIAALVGVLFPLTGAGLALFISGVEPKRPLSPLFVSELAGIGLVLGLGFLAFVFLPRRKLAESSLLRSLCIAGLALPLLAALYFLFVVAWPVKLVWLAVGGVCVACVVSLRNPEAKYA